MVHALAEIRRVLVPEGILIDIRPLSDRWSVEVVSAGGVRQTGRVDDFAQQLNADQASNQAMKEVESRGWFRREQEDSFLFFYSWDTPSEMEEFISDDWSDFIGLSEEARQATRSAWAIGEADSRVQIAVKISITKWRVTGEKIRDADQS